jgi:Ku70/Ku80 beta-barrel domain
LDAPVVALGAPIYHTTYRNFAPRLGIANKLYDRPGQEVVLRLGGGIYYDLGQQLGSLYGGGYGPGEGVFAVWGAPSSGATLFGPSASFPLCPSQLAPPVTSAPPYGIVFGVPRNLRLPYTMQWSASVEHALGSGQTLTLSYVGSGARRLIVRQYYNLAPFNPAFTSLYWFSNRFSSSYGGLQAQYRRAMGHGLEALASWTERLLGEVETVRQVVGRAVALVDWWNPEILFAEPCGYIDMATSVWKGQISFGMVSFPVKLCAAARRQTVRFHQLHPCARPSRIRQVLYCRAEDKPVPRTELVKGFEYDRDRYVLVEDHELRRLAPPSSRTLLTGWSSYWAGLPGLLTNRH